MCSFDPRSSPVRFSYVVLCLLRKNMFNVFVDLTFWIWCKLRTVSSVCLLDEWSTLLISRCNRKLFIFFYFPDKKLTTQINCPMSMVFYSLYSTVSEILWGELNENYALNLIWHELMHRNNVRVRIRGRGFDQISSKVKFKIYEIFVNILLYICSRARLW